MRILMVSPHPVYSARGTPISVLNRCRALSELGHEVDLVTYPIGEDVPVDGLTYLRARVPGISSVRVGPSAAKVPLDAAVLAKAVVRAVREREAYDVLHTHEEAGVLALLPTRVMDLPHVYDMGNDLSTVASNYGMPKPITWVAGAVERAIVRRSDVVIAHFPCLAERVAHASRSTPVHVVYNVPFEPVADGNRTASFRRRWSDNGRPVVVYTGTLEPYQGLPSLLEAMELLRSVRPAPRLVVVGGSEEQARVLRERTMRLGDVVHVEGAIPQAEVPSALAAADLLISPRAGGANTPLKIFSYLHSGRPVIATRIASHTQVLDDRCAVLVDPTAEGIAAGICRCLTDPSWADGIARNGRALAEREFTTHTYVEAVRRAYAELDEVASASAGPACGAERREAEAGAVA